MANKKIASLITQFMVIGIVVYLLALMAKPAYRMMELQARIDYAIAEASVMQEALARYFKTAHKLPSALDEIDQPHDIRYPDGGGARFDPKGKIQIYFEVEPELKPLKIYLKPRVSQAVLVWDCAVTGAQMLDILPGRCRKQYHE